MHRFITHVVVTGIWMLTLSQTGCGGGGAGGAGGGGARDLMISTTRLKTFEPQYAVVTFVRSSVMAFGVKAMIWDGETLVGELTPRKYIQYKASPGKHLFMAKSEQWVYLNANLIAGKQYVINTDVSPGGYSALIELKPVLPFETKYSKTDVDGWFFNLEAQKPLPDYADIYKAPYLAEVRTAIKDYEEGRVEHITLNPGDDWPHLGLNPPPPEEKK
jgi:hypothetical protein